MAQTLNTFTNSIMDSDSDYPLLDDKSYVFALNLRPVGIGKNGSLTTIRGSRMLTDFSEGQTMRVVMQYESEDNKLYTFLAREDGLSKITEKDMDSGDERLIVEDAEFLRFDLFLWEQCEEILPDGMINVDKIDDQLFFSYKKWEWPRVIDVTKDYSEGFVLEDIIIGRKPPVDAPKIVSYYDEASADERKNKFVSVAYRYKYDDNSYSSLSFYSEPLFELPNSEYEINDKRENVTMVNRYGGVKIMINTGDSRVKEIEVIAREHGTQNGYIIYTANKKKLGIADNTYKTINYNFSSNYTMIDESLIDMLYSRYPRYPESQEIAGNRIFYANYKDGFDLKDKDGNDTIIDYDIKAESAPVSNYHDKTAISCFSYKVGLVYMDGYNECTTILINDDITRNEVNVPFASRALANKLKVRINDSQKPPVWAEKFKFVVQSERLTYQNIHTSIIRKIGSKLYVLLDGENVNKLKEDDIFFLTWNDIDEYNELTVSEIKQIKKDEIDLGKEGLYAIAEGAKDIDIKKNTGSEGKKTVTKSYSIATEDGFSGQALTFSGMDIGDVKTNDYAEVSVKMVLNTSSSNDRTETEIYNDTFFAGKEYSNIYEFLEDNFYYINFDTVFASNQFSVTTNSYFNSYIKNNYYYYWWYASQPLTSGVGMDLSITVNFVRGNQSLTLRTKNQELLDTLWYETSNTFYISNGKHMGADSEGWFDIGFFNGYTWGNGVESYRIKDKFNSNALNYRFMPNSVDPNGYKQVWKKNYITYSGLYNEEMGINNLTLFNPVSVNWKAMPAEYGAINKLISTDGDFYVFMNGKVIRQMYGKSIIADVTGDTSLAISTDVLGSYRVMDYDFGCQHPLTVVSTANIVLFADVRKGKFLYIQGDQMMVLNSMNSKFQYEGTEILKTGKTFIGSFNEKDSEYIFGIDGTSAIAFNTQLGGFSHYYNYDFDFLYGTSGKHLASYLGVVYENEVTDIPNDFVGQGQFLSQLKFVNNKEATSDKIYKALYLQSNAAWDTEIITNLHRSVIPAKAYVKKESYYYTDIFRDIMTNKNIRGIGVITGKDGDDLIFSTNIGTDISVGSTAKNEAGNTSVITRIQKNRISVADGSVFSEGDYLYSAPAQLNQYRPNGAPIRGKWMEVTLSLLPDKEVQLTSVNTELIKSNL